MNSSTKRTGSKPEAVTVLPVGVSRLNCEAVCGLTERQLYELGRRFSIPRLPGKIPVYRADALLALFSASGSVEAGTEAVDEPVTASSVLASIGRRIGGAR